MSGADEHQSREEATAVRDEDTRARTIKKRKEEKRKKRYDRELVTSRLIKTDAGARFDTLGDLCG